jgi:hypothetical protein
MLWPACPWCGGELFYSYYFLIKCEAYVRNRGTQPPTLVWYEATVLR